MGFVRSEGGSRIGETPGGRFWLIPRFREATETSCPGFYPNPSIVFWICFILALACIAGRRRKGIFRTFARRVREGFTGSGLRRVRCAVIRFSV